MATHPKNEEAPHERVPAQPVPAPTPLKPEAELDAKREPATAPAPVGRPEPAGHGQGKAHAQGKTKNNVRKIRLERMMSKAELARRAAVSTLTIDRIERGLPCRMDTKRKILEALGLKPSDRVMVFGPDDRED
jgi:DNA-binding XRE family transcriptional regulator